MTLPALHLFSQSLRFPPLRSCAKLFSICCPSPRSELRPSRPCRLPRLRLRRLFPLRARGETASELAKSFQPTAGSEPGGGFLLLSPLQRRSSGSTTNRGAQVMSLENVQEQEDGVGQHSPAALGAGRSAAAPKQGMCYTGGEGKQR